MCYLGNTLQTRHITYITLAARDAMTRFVMKCLLCSVILMGSFACRASIPLDPRDQAVAEELTRISRELNIHVKSDYWGDVKISIVTRSGAKMRIGTFGNSSKYRTKVVSKGMLGSGQIAVLIEPFASSPYAPVIRAQDMPPMGQYIFLLEGIMINARTVDLWIDIAQTPAHSAAFWR
jgi:hypothetical protein